VHDVPRHYAAHSSQVGSLILVKASLDMGGVILAAAGLSFIGFGAQPPTPELGLMVSEGRNYMSTQWWIPSIPAIAIFIFVMGVQLARGRVARHL